MSTEKGKPSMGSGIDRIETKHLEPGKLAHYTGKEKSGMIDENRDLVTPEFQEAATKKGYNKRGD